MPVEAEEVARTIEDGFERARALGEIVLVSVEVQKWEQVEGVARTIEYASERAKALREIIWVLIQAREWGVFVSILQRTWLLVETRVSALEAFPMIVHIMVLYPELEHDLLDSFRWVDAFLRGEEPARQG